MTILLEIDIEAIRGKNGFWIILPPGDFDCYPLNGKMGGCCIHDTLNSVFEELELSFINLIPARKSSGSLQGIGRQRIRREGVYVGDCMVQIVRRMIGR